MVYPLPDDYAQKCSSIAIARFSSTGLKKKGGVETLKKEIAKIFLEWPYKGRELMQKPIMKDQLFPKPKINGCQSESWRASGRVTGARYVPIVTVV